MRYSQKAQLLKKAPLLIDFFNTPLGYLTVEFFIDTADEAVLTRILIGQRRTAEAKKRHPLPDDIKGQFIEFLNGQRREFQLRYHLVGSDFCKKVWMEVLKIPYGQTRTYQWLAEAVGLPRGQRAVGVALGKNPLPILIPCHRVIYSSGKLGGYSSGIDVKRRLLEIEYYSSLG